MPHRLLIVDDVEDNVRLLRNWFSGKEFEVRTASGGRQALDQAAAAVPDVVLLDLAMPGMDGIEVCRRMQADTRLANVPIIVVTCDDNTDSLVRSLGAGATDYVVKPIQPAMLQARVRAALRMRATLLENERIRAELESAISELSASNEELEAASQVAHERATRDALTGLPNRELFVEQLSGAIEIAEQAQQDLAVLFLDLDRFKQINDSLGHTRGDELLRSVADRLLATVRRSDMVARIAGDEFVISLSNLGEKFHAGVVADKLSFALSRPHQVGDQELFVTPSIGIALYPDHATEAETLIRLADIAMYVAKQRGRNAFQFYEPRMNEATYENLMIENELREAAERDELRLHYQPQIDGATGEVIGVEALVRWQHPERGLVSPGIFLPVAERSGLIVRLGEWITAEALRQAAEWSAEGVGDFPVSINVSIRQLERPDFSSSVALALRDAGLDGHRVCFELTESCLTEDVDLAKFQLDSIRQLGISIHIDDFGTGYSSLSLLGEYPIDTLKIDRSFVSKIDQNPRNAAIARAVVAMAEGLGFDTIAEGVETEAERNFLLQIGCRQLQGFLLARPMPPDELREWLAKRDESGDA